MMLTTTKMSSEKYINSTYSLSESILRLDFINNGRVGIRKSKNTMAKRKRTKRQTMISGFQTGPYFLTAALIFLIKASKS
jgi:hypothetical protein